MSEYLLTSYISKIKVMLVMAICIVLLSTRIISIVNGNFRNGDQVLLVRRTPLKPRNIKSLEDSGYK